MKKHVKIPGMTVTNISPKIIKNFKIFNANSRFTSEAFNCFVKKREVGKIVYYGVLFTTTKNCLILKFQIHFSEELNLQ